MPKEPKKNKLDIDFGSNGATLDAVLAAKAVKELSDKFGAGTSGALLKVKYNRAGITVPALASQRCDYHTSFYF